MKSRYVYTMIWFTLIISFTSCNKEEGYDYYDTGRQSFEYVENNMAVFMSFFDLALRMNAYLEIPEEQRSVMLNDYFPECNIYKSEEGDWLGIKNQDTLFRVVFDGLSLTTETSQWKLYGYGEDYRGNMTINYLGSRSWTLEITSVSNDIWLSNAHLKIHYQGEQFPENFNSGDWSVSGFGQSVTQSSEDEQRMQIDFEVAELLVKIANSRYLFDKGILFMKVNKQEQQREEMVRAELKSAEKGRILQITYKGEIYSYSDHLNLEL